MAKHDDRIKCAQVRKLVETKQYKKAIMLLDTIDINRAKATITDLYAFSEAYLKTERYERAEDMLLQVYDHYPSRKVIYQMVRLMLKFGDLTKAEKFYEKYVERYPDHEDRFILRYRIDKEKKTDYKTRIESLEKLKRVDYMEEWAYELAKLYHKAGQKQKCIEECHDIILWFGDGIIVEKAKMLKSYYEDGTDILNGLDERNQKKVSLEEFKETEKEKKAAGSLFINTRDLGKQITELERQERTFELQKELASELQATTNIQAAIRQELGVNGDEQVEKAIYRLLRQDELKKTETAPEPVPETAREKQSEPVPEARKEEMPAAEPDSQEEEAEEEALNLKELFCGFEKDQKLTDQLSEVLDHLSSDSGAVMRFIITGSDKEQNILFSKQMAKALHTMGKIDQLWVAKIQGGKINGMDLMKQKDKLKNGTLYIESPGEMYKPAIRQLTDLMDDLKQSTVIILSSGMEEAEILLEENIELCDYFPYRFHLDVLTGGE